MLVGARLHVGGAERILADLSSSLNPSLFEVAACYIEENGLIGEAMARRGVQLHAVPRAAGRKSRFSFLRLHRLLRERRIDLIHTHDVRGLMDGGICRLLMPRLRHVHTFHFGNYPHRAPSARRIERAAWRLPDALVAVGKAQAAAIASTYGIRASRLSVLWNGVDATEPNVSALVLDAVRDAPGPVMASISTLIPQKGLEVLIDAAAMLARRQVPFRLLVIGDGPLRSSLERRAAEHGLAECVRFLGWISEASVHAIPACDVFVQSSLWEAMSVSVLEAMACGKPVVATRVGDNDEVVVHDETGLLVPAGDARALAQALQAVLDDPAVREALGRAGRERHAAMFTTRHMTERYERLYQSQLGL